MNKENKDNVVRVTDTEKNLLDYVRAFTSTTTEPEVVVKYKTVLKPLFYEEGKSRVLVIGDLHCPFDLDAYLIHCKQMYVDFQCNRVVLIGDVIDNNFSSYHETDPDGHSGGDELEKAIERLQKWYMAFPEATVVLGNHDRLIRRKAFSGGIPKEWIKEYSDVLCTPTWNYVDHIEIDGVLYVHGEGGTARTRIKDTHQSIVQGHLHTQAYIDWIFNSQQRIFGMQVGTGIDFDSYSFAYAKRGKKPAVSCGVVLNGAHPFLIPMTL